MAFNATQSLTMNTTLLNTTHPHTLPPSTPCNGYTTNGGRIAYATFLVVILILALLGNCFVCIAIALSAKLRKSPTNLFIISLAVSDIGWAIFQTPIRVSMSLHDGKFCFDINICHVFVLTDLVTTPATVSTLFVIAIDRFICVTKPFAYHEQMTKRKAKVIVVSVWLYACIWASLSIFQWSKPKHATIHVFPGPHCIPDNRYFFMTSYFIFTLIPLFAMGIMYFAILRVAIVQIREIRANEVLLPRQDPDNNKTSTGTKTNSRTTHRQLRATGTLAIVYGAFLVCWLPPCIINIIIGLQKANAFEKLKETDPKMFHFIFYTFMEVFPLLSTAVNPIIYNVFNRQFRFAFKVAIYRMLGKKDLVRRTTVINEFGYQTGNETSRKRHACEMKNLKP